MTHVKNPPLAARLLKLIVLTTIVSVPFYAFFSTWFASFTGGLLLWRGFKELLLLAGLFTSVYLCITNTKLWSVLRRNRVLQYSALFALWLLCVTALNYSDVTANLLGIALQLRPLVFFACAVVVAYFFTIPRATLEKLVTLPAVGVAAFGLLQIFVLPYDVLKHFGYKTGVSIPPYFTIDDQLEKLRIASTLRGPNPLGAYLIAPIMPIVAKLHRAAGKGKRLFAYGVYLAALLIVLYASHSRSAWIGLLAAGSVYVLLKLSRTWRLLFACAVVATSLLLGGFVYAQRDTVFVQDVILHDNEETGGEISSNQGRIQAFEAAFADIGQRPVLGCGAGCAGPASFHNKAGARISENFYLQTAQETGIIGLILLLTVHVYVALALLRRRDDFSQLWLAVFVGVSVVSLLSHAWADDTIAYIWWGIAGLLLGGKTLQSTKHT